MAPLSNWLWGTSSIDEVVGEQPARSVLVIRLNHLARQGDLRAATSWKRRYRAQSRNIGPDTLEICTSKGGHEGAQATPEPQESKCAAVGACGKFIKFVSLEKANTTVQLTDTCIKNGGDHFLAEIASREFIDNLVSILKIPALNLDVKNSMLRYIQNWSTSFEGKPALAYVGQTYKTLTYEGPSNPFDARSTTKSHIQASRSRPRTLPSPILPWSIPRQHQSGLTLNSVSDVATRSLSPTESITVGIAASSLTKNAHPSQYRCHTLA